jgi:hypothetical protein
MDSSSVATLRDKPAVTLAGFGLVSGLLSATIGEMFEPAWLAPVARLFYLDPGTMPIGAYYGIAFGLGLALCTGKLWAAPLQLVTILIAWSAAIHTALAIFGDGGIDNMRKLLAAIAAGAVGAGLTHVGAALVVPSLRRPSAIALTTAVGALCGVLHFLGELQLVPSWLLYVVWQPAVAYGIGLAVAGTSPLAGPATSVAHRP